MLDVSVVERRCADLEELLARERKERRLAIEQATSHAMALRVLAREVRGPLDSAVSWSRMLRREMLSKEGRDHALRVIERQIDGSLRLIDDVLAAVTTTPPRRARIRYDEAVRAAQDAVMARAQERSVSMRHELDPIEVDADPMRTERLVARLLDTAIELAAEATEIRIRLDAGGLVCSVDTTASVPELPPGGWEALVSAEGTAQPLAVGLFLLRRLAEAHGARVEVRRDEDGARSDVIRLELLLKIAI
jgi:signal transduction histidine kinase